MKIRRRGGVVTIREIAKRCGVSRGTVDRVINGRGKVHPDTKEKIERMLQEVGYTKNTVGRALTVRKMAPSIGVILSSEGNPFFEDVILGIRKAEEEMHDYGVRVVFRTMRGYSLEEQLSLITSLEGEISVLVFQAINHPRIVQKVSALREKGIPTITVNSDLENSERVCYVGSDYVKGGQTAAGIMRLVTRGKGHLGIVSGVPTILGHVQRLQGFEEHLRSICPRIEVLACESAQDSIEHAYGITLNMLRKHPSINMLIIITAGLEGVCRAVLELGLQEKISVFAFDNIPKTEEMMRIGLLKTVVCQQPFQQGYRSMRMALELILSGEVPEEKIIVENEIKILENLSDLEKSAQ